MAIAFIDDQSVYIYTCQTIDVYKFFQFNVCVYGIDVGTRSKLGAIRNIKTYLTMENNLMKGWVGFNPPTSLPSYEVNVRKKNLPYTKQKHHRVKLTCLKQGNGIQQ